MRACALKLPAEMDMLNSFIEGKKGDIEPGRDILIVVKTEDGKAIRGLFAARQVWMVHELRVKETDPQKARQVADAMVNYAFGVGKATQNTQFPPEALFLVDEDNPRMIGFLMNNGITVKQDGKIYLCEVE